MSCKKGCAVLQDGGPPVRRVRDGQRAKRSRHRAWRRVRLPDPMLGWHAGLNGRNALGGLGDFFTGLFMGRVNQMPMFRDCLGEASTRYGKLLTRLTAQRKPPEMAIIRASCARRGPAATAGVCHLEAKTCGRPGPSLRLSLPGRHLVNSVASATLPASEFRECEASPPFRADCPEIRADDVQEAIRR